MQVSKLSQLGFCQAAFKLSHERKIVTARMADGINYHNRLASDIPLFMPNDSQKVRAGAIFSAREIDVSDKSLMLTGRIDQVDFCGFARQGNALNLSVLFDDKFPKNPVSFKMSDTHKIQLAAYATAFENDNKFKDVSKIFFASIRVWDKAKIVNTFDVNRRSLERWENIVPDLIDVGKRIVWNRQDAQPVYFCMDERKWCDVGARCAFCKYGDACNYRNASTKL
ncbi:MAG: PD-(D/E)XK nuclease family protein [Candidatus Aenigmatarchaeota archaeon]